MSIRIIVNAADSEECRIAKLRDNKLDEFQIESKAREITHGNIYKGVITRIEPGLQSVFVDYGAERHGFLQKSDIHSDYFLDSKTGDHSIKSIVRKGQEVLVQITKDPVMHKGAMLTTYISLPSRNVVLMPGSKNKGISRKIEDEKERVRLKEIVEKIKLPEGFGIIVRTAGSNSNKTKIAKDIRYLRRLWENINKKGMEVKAPALLYKERNLVVRSIRDYFTSDVKEILVDDHTVFQEVRDFMKIISPKQVRNVKFYKEDRPIFSKYGLEDQIASIFEKRVDLKSGGSIDIAQTEALVAIDVNSGKATKKTIEQTAFQANMEAAEEIARQLRLRDLGGLIVIDFIDMKDAKHKSEVEKAVKKFLKEDKARTKVGRISKFGLMEMSRQRIRPPIEFGGYTICQHCKGKGMAPSTETLSLRFLRKLQLEAMKENIESITAHFSSDVADYLLNRKRKEILDLEIRRGISIFIEGQSHIIPSESEIVSHKKKAGTGESQGSG